MKATLEFNLPEDKQDFDLATKASNWWQVCWEMDRWLRAECKYTLSDDAYSEDKYNAYQEARRQLSMLMQQNGVSLDDVQ